MTLILILFTSTAQIFSATFLTRVAALLSTAFLSVDLLQFLQCHQCHQLRQRTICACLVILDTTVATSLASAWKELPEDLVRRQLLHQSRRLRQFLQLHQFHRQLRLLISSVTQEILDSSVAPIQVSAWIRSRRAVHALRLLVQLRPP